MNVFVRKAGLSVSGVILNLSVREAAEPEGVKWPWAAFERDLDRLHAVVDDLCSADASEGEREY